MGYFNEKDYLYLFEGFNKINEDTKALWGKMSAAQMLAHCREVTDACNGKPLSKTPFFIKIVAGFIKKSVLNDKAYPLNSATHHQYKIVDERDLNTEKTLLLDALERFYSNDKPTKHSLFGTMTPQERNRAILKHHKHHLRQFGIID